MLRSEASEVLLTRLCILLDFNLIHSNQLLYLIIFVFVHVMLGSYFALKRVEYPSRDLLYPFPYGINKPLKSFFTALGSNKYPIDILLYL